ncbi:competence/damage-inducible protein A [Kordiimonas sp. SCSIO 12603]|uniref:competence/damage-inducible protein A n=1 Tax=Kordiimonas sp. SCSIO 12603 TaxID=2829596 RepID=UPI0021069CC1|nr:competence/damage-inducible protein A [Kordiimonas sp. SCSIO 12603]UTW57781.1 competence/damage-inducible protein A [Kordiimonas sp. SCSIO 12603]
MSVNAALLIIGDEILSGRTQDANLAYLAKWLNETGIQLVEVRVVPDIEQEIVEAVNALRTKYDYLFTTGGIGPTHDDITVDSIAAAFGVPVVVHEKAYQMLLDYYGEENFTEARKRMTRVPEGAELIDNPVSIAPGINIENVFIMAGVPKIMQSMLEGIRPHLRTGRKVWSQSMTVYAPESKIAEELGAIQENNPETGIGSYPFYYSNTAGAQIVVRSADQGALKKAMDEVQALCFAKRFETDEPSELS